MYRRFNDGVYGSMAYSQIFDKLCGKECECAFSRASPVSVNPPLAPVSNFAPSSKRLYIGYSPRKVKVKILTIFKLIFQKIRKELSLEETFFSVFADFSPFCDFFKIFQPRKIIPTKLLKSLNRENLCS